MSLTNPENIYQVGGSLPVHASTYVERLADNNLYEGLLAGNFCYVLNSRQMGKSSLRVQTMKRLQEAGILCTAIDLTSIGSQDITPEQWYAGIIYSLASGLELLDKFNLGEWWQDRQFLSPLQRLGQFLSEIVLREIQGKIVIFIDEIDSVLSLSFNVDDFFGLIRSCYQKDSNYERLAFALFGVASPADLIRNKNTNNNFSTPFNIGQAIDLQGFQLSEAMPLAEGFRNIFERPEEILKGILDWTGGQPFLTQKVCKLVSKYGQAYSENIVSNVVQEKIIENWEGQDEPEHLKTIRDRLLYSSKNKYKLLELYYRILQEGAINDQNLPEYTELRLTGLVVKQNTKLKVYNRIYAEVFNLEWLTDEFKSSGSIIASGSGDNVSDPFIYISRGLTYYNAKDYEGAIFNYSQAIELNPNYASAYNYRGNVHSKLKDYKEAISDYNRAISIEPHYIIALMNRGLAYFDLEKYQEAISDFEQVINIDPNHAPAYYHRGVTYYELGDYERAITDYNKTINIEPNDIKAYDKRANTYRELGKYEEAIADYDQVISIDPSYIVAYIKRREKVHGYLKDSDMNKINFYHSRGLDSYKNRDYYGAISDFEQIIGIHPNDALAYNNRGRCFFKLGKYQEALNDYNQAISIDPYSSFFYRNRGEVYCSLNYYEAAIADYNRAINIDPNDNIAHMGWAIAQKKLNQSLTVIPDIKENIDLKSNINQDLVYKTFEFETVTVNKKGEIIKRENKQAKYFTEILPNNIALDMVEIPGGSFIMGSPETEIGRYKDEGPQHEVIIQTFYMGKYPITQAQYEAVMNYNPSKFDGKNRPVERVTWQKAKEFCAILSNLTGKKYFLPSESQWEYAARAGTTTAFHYGETITSKLANYAGNTYNQEPKGEWRKETTDVGIFPPNAFGLYDIHGNVWEWCEDEWHENYEGMPIDGSAWILSETENKVLRGGAFVYDTGSCRVANRTCLNIRSIITSVGFRVCCLIENADDFVESQEQQIYQRFIESKYIRLEQLLANQRWKEADQETARVMLEIAMVKREEEALLHIEAIKNFPCDDLNIIDKLWLKYSNGLFGFSIQKKIWSEYDNKLDDETQFKLGDHLGWRKQGTWLKYEEINFGIDDLYPGHLPWTVWGFLQGEGTSHLASKLISCNISNTQNSLIEEGFLGDFSVNGKLVRIFQGDITNLVVDVIITSDDDSLSMEGILSRKIRAMGGEEIYQELQNSCLLCIGDIGITSGGNLACQKIFHAIVADYANSLFTAPDFKKLVHNCLNIAEELELQTLALPLLGAGGNGFNPKIAWQITLQEIIKYFSNNSCQYLQEVVIVIYRKQLVISLNIENTLQRIACEGWEYLLNETD